MAINNLRSVAASKGLIVAAKPLAKIKTTLTMIAIIGLLVADAPLPWTSFTVTDFLAQIVLYSALSVSIYTGADYFVEILPKLEEAGPKPVDSAE